MHNSSFFSSIILKNHFMDPEDLTTIRLIIFPLWARDLNRWLLDNSKSFSLNLIILDLTGFNSLIHLAWNLLDTLSGRISVKTEPGKYDENYTIDYSGLVSFQSIITVKVQSV